MSAFFMRRCCVLLILYFAIILCLSPSAYSADSVITDEITAQPPALSIDLAGENDEFSLNQYYNELEPPDQGGFLGRYSVLGEDTMYFAVPGLAIIGIIYMLPEDVSKWERDDMSWGHLWGNWKENVTSWEWDDDEAWINYIGHPYFGSAYFIHARHYGYSRMESLCYSLAMSSIYEILLEAWAEPVSIQDMIFTPLLGWGLAELLLPLEYKIKQNDSKVLNSRIAGAISLFLIDPFGHIILPLKRWTKGYFSDDAEMNLSPSIEYHDLVDNQGRVTGTEERYELTFTVRW
jgi:hypothetical protein